MFDVVCYGAISLDVSGRLERPRREYGQATAVDYRLSPGGDAALVALTLAGLGLGVALAGSPVGTDPIGDQVLGMLEKEGVTPIVPRAGKTAITAIVLDGDKRSTITFHEDTPEAKIPIPDGELMGSKYIYVDGCFGRNGAIIARMARANGVKTLLNLDIPSIPNLGLFDTVISNETVATLLADDPPGAARRIHDANKGLAIVTLGEKGCICFDGGSREIPALRVEAADTTGAGAAFAAGFIYMDAHGEPLEACLEFASAAGAYKSLARGSYRTFSANEIYRFIKNNKKQALT